MFTSLVAELMGLDDAGVTERFRELELQRRRLEAETAAVVAVAEARGVYGTDGHRSVAGWMRAHANWSPSAVGVMRKTARLVDRCPVVGDALLAGHIGVAQVGELARAHSNRRCGAEIVDVIDTLLDSAEHLAFEDFRTVVRRWEMLADEDGAVDTAEANHANRTAGLHEVNGCLDLRASGGWPLTAAEMLGIFERFVEAEFRADVAARTELHGPDAPASLLARTDAQRRFDALVAIFRRASSMPADARAPSPVVNIVCDQATFELLVARHRLIPCPDDLALTGLVDARCETDGGIAVPPDHVLQAALQGHVRRVVVDRDGVVVDMGRKRRLFTGSAREAAKLMATRCGHRGCTVGSRHAEVDHLREWVRDRGPTDTENSSIRCRSHNRWKHLAGVVDRRDDHGRLVTYRPDGTAMVPVGCRTPNLTDDPTTAADPITEDAPTTEATVARCETLTRLLDEIRRLRQAVD